jgi:hypothetical protein
MELLWLHRQVVEPFSQFYKYERTSKQKIMNEENLNQDTPRTKVITLSLNKAFVIMASAIIASAGSAIWGTLAIANTIPFRVNAVEQEITDIKRVVDDNNVKFMPLDLSTEKWKNNDKEHNNIMDKLEVIDRKVDQILKEL